MPIKIDCKDEVKRGEKLTGNIIIGDYKNARGIEVTISCIPYITYKRRCPFVKGLKFFNIKLEKVPSSIPLEFKVPEDAPVTFKGKNVGMYWIIDVKIDIPFWFDVHEKKEIIVKR
ncbi:MAG: hypothetical protein QXS37_02195 [Candidatus Aenigmatarchaeota archaeon]